MGLEVLYLLIPASALLAGIALALFLWAMHTGQFDDLETPAIRMLYDDGTDGLLPPAPGDAASVRNPQGTAEPKPSTIREDG